MDHKQLLRELDKAILAKQPDAVNIFKMIHHKHNGLDERDISPNGMRKLIRLVLKHELEAGKSPSTLVDVLVTACRRVKSPLQVDMLVYRGGFTTLTMESIPFTIAKSSLSMENKLVWLKAIANHDELSECFDLNRPVGTEGNLVVNSYAKLHLHDIEWYEYLLLDLRLAVNTRIRHKTLMDFILRDQEKGRAPKCAKKLLDLLDHCGGKTNAQLKQ